jgi:hypothetical protein
MKSPTIKRRAAKAAVAPPAASKAKASPPGKVAVAREIAAENRYDRELILDKAQRWARNRIQARRWFLTYEIPEFGGNTASELLKMGKKQALLDYIERVELGSYV